MYDTMPDVSCECDRLGQCCELNKAEIETGNVHTMGEIHLSEFLNIVRHVAHREDFRALVDLDAPWEKCVFLTTDGGCGIHETRPFACRKFGLLTRDEFLSIENPTDTLGDSHVEYNVCDWTVRKSSQGDVDRFLERVEKGYYGDELEALSDPYSDLFSGRSDKFREVGYEDGWIYVAYFPLFCAALLSTDEWFDRYFVMYAMSFDVYEDDE